MIYTGVLHTLRINDLQFKNSSCMSKISKRVASNSSSRVTCSIVSFCRGGKTSAYKSFCIHQTDRR